MPTLLLIIPSVWLTIVVLVVLLCRGAARGDRALYEQGAGGDRERYPGWPADVHAACQWRERRLQAAPLRVPDGRARGGRCATGS